MQLLGNDKRYLQMFDQPQGITSKRVLVVDDNVAYGGTMEIVNDLLLKRQPEEIVIFTPFYMGTVSSVYR